MQQVCRSAQVEQHLPFVERILQLARGDAPVLVDVNAVEHLRTGGKVGGWQRETGRAAAGTYLFKLLVIAGHQEVGCC
jgi:hypothetical protein